MTACLVIKLALPRHWRASFLAVITRTTIVAAFTLGAALLPTIAHADSGSCTTTGRFPHSIEQKCDDGSTQEVFFPAAISAPEDQGLIHVTSSRGQTTTGAYVGPWIVWTDFNGAQCATPGVVSQKLDFYPLTCPPAGVPTAGLITVY